MREQRYYVKIFLKDAVRINIFGKNYGFIFQYIRRVYFYIGGNIIPVNTKHL